MTTWRRPKARGEGTTNATRTIKSRTEDLAIDAPSETWRRQRVDDEGRTAIVATADTAIPDKLKHFKMNQVAL